ncbi:MAG TPA: cell envelope biogenesis protein OmpA, partial [Bacteroidales bacterium]|nr:cell envelope biogenesis protein OmpA [Bacteroidales bacterium]
DFFLLHSVGLTFNFGQKKDADGDGVADRLDKCPDTPVGVLVDAAGCPLDADGDGVPDYLDKCANTPPNIQVDAMGCPLDEDKDGVPDYLDKCPKTPIGVAVDADGCPLDTDKDGVPDHLDKCPNTPSGVQVDVNGCPLDEDKDGVPDYLDKCPQTPIGATVDEFGCTLDTDGDGIPDYLDKCPTVAGTKENDGCPELTKEVKTLFQKALQGIKFDTGKSTIKPVSFQILDAVVKVMIENPNYKLIIGGHTDNVGGEAMNMTLSKNRAEAVSVYLISKGISPTRISSEGFGLTKPVDDNSTAAGRTRNRRVELSVEFTEKVIVPVEK